MSGHVILTVVNYLQQLYHFMHRSEVLESIAELFSSSCHSTLFQVIIKISTMLIIPYLIYWLAGIFLPVGNHVEVKATEWARQQSDE